jgi:hypothetical protein
MCGDRNIIPFIPFSKTRIIKPLNQRVCLFPQEKAQWWIPGIYQLCDCFNRGCRNSKKAFRETGPLLCF